MVESAGKTRDPSPEADLNSCGPLESTRRLLPTVLARSTTEKVESCPDVPKAWSVMEMFDPRGVGTEMKFSSGVIPGEVQDWMI